MKQNHSSQNYSSRLAMIAVTVVAFLLGCSMSNMGGNGKGSGNKIVAHLFTGNHSSAHIIPTGQTIIASDESESGIVHAFAPTPLSQSFDAVCNNLLDFSVVPAGAFVPIPISRAGVSDCNFFSTAIQGGGKRVHDTAALGNLVVDVTLDDNSELTCEDRTNAPSVTDSTLVQAYFVPSSGQTVVANDLVVTSLTCSVTIPPGRSVKVIEAQWTKG